MHKKAWRMNEQTSQKQYAPQLFSSPEPKAQGKVLWSLAVRRRRRRRRPSVRPSVHNL